MLAIRGLREVWLMQGYTIWSPPYNDRSAGVRALHVLRDELRARGCEASMHYEVEQSKFDIVVYPEVCDQNILNAKVPIRWYLNKHSFKKQIFKTVRNPLEAFRQSAKPTFFWDLGMAPILARRKFPLAVDVIEKELWVPSVKRRRGVAYYVGKGNLDLNVVPTDAIEITKDFPNSRSALVDLVSRVELLISFDPLTALNLESVLTGTPVYIHAPRERWSKAEIMAMDSSGPGWAWSIDEIDQARQSVGLAYEKYQLRRLHLTSQLDFFVEKTQALF